MFLNMSVCTSTFACLLFTHRRAIAAKMCYRAKMFNRHDVLEMSWVRMLPYGGEPGGVFNRDVHEFVECRPRDIPVDEITGSGVI